MKVLHLDSVYRQWLNLNEALSFDGDLNEKFIGLTHNESIFFAEMLKTALQPLDLRTVDELKRFIELQERHECTLALQRKASRLKT
jgi:hypothetical protein